MRKIHSRRLLASLFMTDPQQIFPLLKARHVDGRHDVKDAMKFVFGQPGVSSMIVGTINPQHLRSNVEDLNAVLS